MLKASNLVFEQLRHIPVDKIPQELKQIKIRVQIAYSLQLSEIHGFI